jgi:hypothetical protein
MSQTLREEPRCPLILPLPSRSDSAMSANAAVGGTANRAALCVVLLGVRHLCRVSVPVYTGHYGKSGRIDCSVKLL